MACEGGGAEPGVALALVQTLQPLSFTTSSHSEDQFSAAFHAMNLNMYDVDRHGTLFRGNTGQDTSAYDVSHRSAREDS